MIVRNGLDYGGHKMYLSPYLKKTNLEVYDNNDYLSILVFLINEDSYNAILNLFLDRKTNIFHKEDLK